MQVAYFSNIEPLSKEGLELPPFLFYRAVHKDNNSLYRALGLLLCLHYERFQMEVLKSSIDLLDLPECFPQFAQINFEELKSVLFVLLRKMRSRVRGLFEVKVVRFLNGKLTADLLLVLVVRNFLLNRLEWNSFDRLVLSSMKYEPTQTIAEQAVKQFNASFYWQGCLQTGLPPNGRAQFLLLDEVRCFLLYADRVQYFMLNKFENRVISRQDEMLAEYPGLELQEFLSPFRKKEAFVDDAVKLAPAKKLIRNILQPILQSPEGSENGLTRRTSRKGVQFSLASKHRAQSLSKNLPTIFETSTRCNSVSTNLTNRLAKLAESSKHNFSSVCSESKTSLTNSVSRHLESINFKFQVKRRVQSESKVYSGQSLGLKRKECRKGASEVQPPKEDEGQRRAARRAGPKRKGLTREVKESLLEKELRKYRLKFQL